MAERRRTRAAATAERPAARRPPAGDPPERAARGRRPINDEPAPADDELEPADEEPELAEDEFGPADEEDDEDEVTGNPPASNGRRRAQKREDPALTARQAVRAALQQIADLTTKQPEDITGVQRTDDGWAICFEVIEDHRIPSSSDILATYEAVVDAEGELTSYRRVRRYSRGRGDSSEGVAT